MTRTSRVALAAVVLAVLWVVSAAAQEPAVRYDIEVELDPRDHTLRGVQRVQWRNTSDAATSELWWHLYLNAFAGNRTTFMQELGDGALRVARPAETEWGWIRIDRMELTSGVDLLPTLEFVRPDDGNLDDFTVARVVLPGEVPPGAAVELELEFEAQLPGIVARTGYAGDFHLVAQWFPKLAVFEGGRGWNCHQFHATTEFYADFGSYRVAVTLPGGWVVGATGLEVERAPADNGRQRLVFAAAQVHDFAFAAAPSSLMTVVEEDFDPARDVPMVWLERSAELLGKSIADLQLPPMQLRLLLPRSQLRLAPRMLRAARLAVAWLGLHYGPYPYPQLTIVSTPPTAMEAGGMEYPTFITTGASRVFTVPPMRWLPWIETVTVHEFGHQYFQGLLASNEFEQGWLDEGLNSFVETECLESIVADRLAPDLRWGGFWTRERLSFGRYPTPGVIDQRPWRFRSRGDYYQASFTASALVLKTLQGIVGTETFARAMREYVERYRFQHPTGDDLEAVFTEVVGEDLGWFFDQALRSEAAADWAVLRVSQRRPRSIEGFVWSGDGWRESEDDDVADSRFTIEVEIGRRGEFVGPVDTRLVFADGRVERRRWDGGERWVRWRFDSDSRLNQVVVDPDGVWAIEVARADNYWRDAPDDAAAARRLWWLADALQLLGLLHVTGG